MCLLACRVESPAASDDDAAATQSSASASVPQDAWGDLGITKTRAPQRLLIRKIGWRGGPEALVVEGEQARRLHRLLAGNERLDYACGYHWSVDFEYDYGVVESIPINENCESFRRSGEQIWQILNPYFKRVSDHPSHYLIRVETAPGAKLSVERELEPRLGLAFNTDPAGKTLLLAHPEPWSPERHAAIRKASSYVTLVEQIKTYDTGS